MMVLRIALAVLLTAFLSTAQAQLDSQWIGKWKGSNKSTLDISPGGMRYRYIECDEDGSGCAQVKPLACVWTRDGDALKNNPDGSCRIGESRPKEHLRAQVRRPQEGEAPRASSIVLRWLLFQIVWSLECATKVDMQIWIHHSPYCAYCIRVTTAMSHLPAVSNLLLEFPWYGQHDLSSPAKALYNIRATRSVDGAVRVNVPPTL